MSIRVFLSRVAAGLHEARHSKASPGDIAALVALISTVVAVVLVRRELRR